MTLADPKYVNETFRIRRVFEIQLINDNNI